MKEEIENNLCGLSPKDFEKEIGLSASSHTCYDLNQAVFLFADQFIQVNIPFNLHIRPPFRKKVTLHLFSEYIIPDLQEKFNMGRIFYYENHCICT